MENQEELISKLKPLLYYGSIWINIDTNICYAYDKNKKWVTSEETDDPVLKELLDPVNLIQFNMDKNRINHE